MLSGEVPLEVSFGIGGIVLTDDMQILWDFDNDGLADSEALTPIYTFEYPDNHSVSLQVSYKDYENGSAFINYDTSTVLIEATSSNHPVVLDLSLSTNEDTAISAELSAANPLNTSINFIIDENPRNGTVSIDGSTLTYTPNTNFFGSDTLKYFANNGDFISNIAMIDVTVHAVDDTPTTIDIATSMMKMLLLK